LRLALSAHLDVEPDAIVIANGTAAVISTSLATLAPQRCLAPTPAFSEYRDAYALSARNGARLRSTRAIRS
jgi:histidinol-phosphate/aromatic aminotransferase/cobyric acid decarboxylase-like protein